jgi:hypothetical protein
MHTVDFPRDDTSDAPPTRAPARAPALPAPVLSWLQRVEAAEAGADLFIQAVQRGQVAGVDAQADRVVADAFDGGIEFGLAATGDDHLRAFEGEALGGGQADAAGGAGDESDFVGEFGSHDLLLWLMVGWVRCPDVKHRTEEKTALK